MLAASKPLVITEDLINRFRRWLVEEGLDPDSKTLREYMSKLSQLKGRVLTGRLVRTYAGRSKRWYETLRRLITFVGVRSGLGMKQLAEELLEYLPKKPAVGTDTYMPSREEVIKAGRRLARSGFAVYWILLVATGARLSTLHALLGEFNPKRLVFLEDRGIARYHVDYVRGEKYQWDLYAPAEWWRKALELMPPPRLSYERTRHVIGSAGLRIGYYRNFAYNMMLALGVPQNVAEYIVGHKIGGVSKHYIAPTWQGDKHYPKYAAWLRENIPLGEILEERGLRV